MIVDPSIEEQQQQPIKAHILRCLKYSGMCGALMNTIFLIYFPIFWLRTSSHRFVWIYRKSKSLGHNLEFLWRVFLKRLFFRHFITLNRWWILEMMLDGKPFDESHQYIYKNSFVNGSFIPEYLLSLYLCKVKCFIHMPISCNGTHLLHSHCFKYHQYLLLSLGSFLHLI